ncbi:retrovirus-related pol polyprotein from transposon TNT 1-94 [Tanacetum coccineum]
MKNKVEAQPRKVNKKNRIIKPICDDNVKHLKSNANSDLNCATCKKSLFDDVHDKCLLDFVKTVNRSDKSAKKHKKQNIWRPTGHVFTEVGLKWKPIGRTFTIVGSSKKAKIVESKNTNHSEPNHTWGSNATNIPSSSSLVMTACPDCSLVSGLRMFETHDRESLSAHELSKDGLARGIPRLKFQKDHLCSACALGKSKKSSHKPKAEDTNQKKLTNDEAPEAIIKCIKNIQVRLNAIVRNVQTDNGTKFVNQILREFYENVGISHQTSVAHTPQQNVVVKRRNRTLVEVARTMLIFSKAPLFLWAEDKKPDLSIFHVIGALCYPTNDNDDLGKFDAKSDVGIFVGYAPAKKAFRIYNKRTQKFIETIHVTFDKLTAMASEQFSSGPRLQCMTSATSSSGLVPNPVSQQPCIPLYRDDWDHFFQTMFDEYFTLPPIVVTPVQEVAAPRAVDFSFEESPKTPVFRDDPLNESFHEESTSQGSSLNVRQTHTLFEHIGKWTKNHPIANMIGIPSRSVSTRKQFQTDAMWCLFDAFLTSVELKNFKQAMTEPS